MRLGAMVLCAVVLAGCGSTMRWAKPGATVQEFSSDSYDCARAAQRPARSTFVVGRGGLGPLLADQDDMSGDLYRACLQARGYERTPEGAWKGLD